MRASSITKMIAAAIALTVAVPSATAVADFAPKPKKKVDCRKHPSNPACNPDRPDATQDEIYNAAYWMNRAGRFQEALDLLRRTRGQAEARVLNEMGYATRKLGDVAGALVYYRRALAVDPDYVYARAYMGEALLLQGDAAAASEQLAEIGRRCGTGCTAYAHLAEHIAKH